MTSWSLKFFCTLDQMAASLFPRKRPRIIYVVVGGMGFYN
jgi:hypothetical protein